MTERKNKFFNIKEKLAPLYKGRLDTATPTKVSYLDYLYDLIEPHFAYYPHDVFLIKRDGKIYLEVYDQEAYDYVLQDLEKNFKQFEEEYTHIAVTLLKPEEK